MYATVALVAAAAAAATVAITMLMSPAEPAPVCPGGIPLELDFGVRTDGEAVALRRAMVLYARGSREAAERIFTRYSSVDARVGAALAGPSEDRLPGVRTIASAYPRRAVARLHLGYALFCSGRPADARREWRAAKRVEPDSAAAVRADDRLHPQYAPGLPTFVPGFEYPRSLARLMPAAQLARLAREARDRDVRAKLLYGVALQRLQRPLSARRVYAQAAALAPRSVEAQVAAAVGRFDKDRPAEAFSRLGPLARRFPRAPTVRFHLGLLLLWIGDVEEGKRQLARAARQAPSSPLSRVATRFLRRLDGEDAGATTRTRRAAR